MSEHKIFNDGIKSRLQELYPTVDSILACKPQVTLPDGRIVTLTDLENGIKNSVPFCREWRMDFELTAEDGIDYAAVERVTRSLLTLPKSEDNCCVKMIKVSAFDNVKFQHAKMEDSGKVAKLKPACFKIEVPACLPNTVQNINTGYIVDIGKEMENYDIDDGKIIKSARPVTQKKLVVIPQVLSKNKSIVPQLCARDYEDSGPYTVSLLNLSGEACTIFVYLYAYKVCKPSGSLRFGGGDSDKAKTDKVLKPKDSRDGRYVYNLGVNVLFDSGRVSENKGKIEFSCFDGTKTNHDVMVDKSVIMDNLCVFFSTRKREWCNSKLFTVAGLFRPYKEYVAPLIAKGSEYNINTHCCVLLDSRMTLFTTEGKLNSTHVLMNGTMFDWPKYKILKKARSALIRNVYSLRSGYKAARRLDSKVYDDPNALMLIYDYGFSLIDNAELKKYYNKRDDECALFDYTNKSFKRTISSRLYKNMTLLIDQFISKSEDVKDGVVATTPTTAVDTNEDKDTKTKRNFCQMDVDSDTSIDDSCKRIKV